MDWEANLAAIIRCTDASLEQQFRQFEDVTAEFEAPAQQQHEDPGDNVGAAYLRETMSADYRHRQQEQPRQTPSYTRISGAFPRGPATSAQSSTTSFSEHFHRQQERKRGAGRARDNQRTHRRGNEYGPAGEDAQVQDHDVDELRYRQAAGSSGAYHQQMYSSPTYDMVQMMEQVRLSLKLEVDARAAIAERQLSALLQLCKATSEELDRLRVEVCANDRQLHTLDQVQSKIRQELTTQKDIGFHLQSMCGKDESWRMQTENQMLELRQMVAALREQGNSTQAVAQEKLSRSELLVQFNAAMEPIKAQLQANLQHQAQQIAEITRATSSSSLLLDGLTQKVNRGVTDELNELRGDLNALKHHVAKLDIFQDGGRGDGRSPPVSKEETEAKAKEEQQQQEKRMTDVREGILKDLKMVTKDYVDAQIQPIRKLVDDSGSRFIGKQEIENLRSALEEGCRNRCTAAAMQADSQLKAAQEQLRGESNAAMRETSDRIEKSMQQTGSTMMTALEKQAASWQNKQLEFVKLIESEQKERKQALDELHEALRKSRHQLEDQIHTLSQESRTRLSQHDSDLEKRLTSVEKQVEKAVADLQRENQVAVVTLKSSLHAQGVNRDAEWEQKLKRLEDTISGTNLSVAALSKSLKTPSSTSTSIASNDSSSKEVNMALEKQTSVYVSTMENLLQKMQLQLQVQAQSQAQMAMVPSPYHGFWPPSPYAASHAPPPPTLHLPPAMNRSSTEHHPLTPLGAVHAISAPVSTPPALRSDHPITVGTPSDKSSNSMKEESASEEKYDDRVRSATPVKQLEHPSTTSPPPNESSSLSSSPPAVSESASKPKLTVDQGDLKNSDRNLHKQDDPNNRGHTLATTVKGALEEAELAKVRVENRRKQEQEAKQQQQQRQPPVQAGLVTPQLSTRMEVPVSNSKSPTDGSSRRSSVPAILTGQAPPLTRSASSSALPGKGDVVRTNPPAVGNNPPTPASIPSTPTAPRSAITTFPPPPASVPPQSLTKSDGVPVVISTPKGPSETKPSMAAPSTVRAPQNDSKREVDFARPPPIQPVPNDHKPALPQHSLSATPRQDMQKLTSPREVPTATDECSPPLSPLAKIFARPPTAETPRVDHDDSARAETQPSGKTLPIPTSGKAEEINQSQLPSAPAPTSPLSGVYVRSPPVSHVLCSLCRLPVRSDQKSEHEKSQCPKRMVECVSCKQQMQWANLEIHELDCNSAETSKVEVGAESNPSETKSPLEVGNAAELGGSVKKCRHCSADVSSLDLLEHEINCDKVLKQCPHCLRRQKMSELQDHIENCDCRLVSCPNDCGGKFLQRGIPNHLATRCPKKPMANSVPVVAAAPRPAYPDANKPTPPPQTTQPPSAAAPSGKVECKFCDDEIEASKIDDHEQNCDWKPKRCQHCNMVVISRDLLRHETSCKTNLKSCPHCNENMPQSALITHAGRCSKRPIKCIRCCQLFPADAIVAHSTNCKFVPGTNPASGNPSPQPQSHAVQLATSRAPIKIPPPPPFPPPPTATAPVPASQLNTRRATADPRVGVNQSNDTAELTGAEETTSDRLARRNLALSQLTNPNVPATGGNTLLQDRNSGARASAPSLYSTTTNSLQTRLNTQHDGHEDAEDEEDEDDEEYDDEDEDDQLTLAQVVKEWSVENVCLWLHEDVGVPDVVLRFQQKQCNGEMLLELTESDLINDFGVKDRVQRERILNAIEAINTSTFSDEDDEDDDEEEYTNEDDEEELEESEEHNADSSRPHTRHSIGGATYGHPRDILRRKSQPSPQRILDSSLPSSNDMLRRISNALENPKR